MTTLFLATLGQRPEVVTLAFDLLREREDISGIAVIHTDAQVSGVATAVAMLKVVIASDYPSLDARFHELARANGAPLVDMTDYAAAMDYFTGVYNVLRAYKEIGTRIHFLVSGGRKAMSIYATLAAALVSSKLGIPIAHVEAGLRSFDRTMPEEINRLVADQLSSAFFCVSQTAVQQLAREGITENVFWVGDVMLDANLASRPLARQRSTILSQLGLAPGSFGLVTVHRAANTDDPARLANIVTALSQVGETVVFPVHPRTRGALEKLDVQFAENVRVIEPVGYYDMSVPDKVPVGPIVLVADPNHAAMQPLLRGYVGTRFRLRVWWVPEWGAAGPGEWLRWAFRRELWSPEATMDEWLYVRRDIATLSESR